MQMGSHPERLGRSAQSRVTTWRWLLAPVLAFTVMTFVASCGKQPSCMDKRSDAYDACVKRTGCGNVTCGCYSEKSACASGCYGSSGYSLVAPEPDEAVTTPLDSLAGSSYGAGLISAP